MFYANNEQVKGIFLNGSSYNYLAYGFGKIIPENRSAEQLNLNLAYKYLNQYRIEFGSIKDGYDNALVSPRFDKPDSSGVFHTPFTYYYNGNIIPTKEVSVLITNGNCAIRNALVYNDININGAINYFATNTDFQGHNVNVFKEADSYQVYQALLKYEMLNNCSNFDLNIETRFSKTYYPTLYNCNNFSGNFRYVGNSDINYPGFSGFLEDCKDGVFNIDCTNMHGGGSDANVTNYYNFSGIQSCENMNVNITGSSWQAWVHPNCHSSNCNITTRYIVPGFDYMNHCNFNIYLPSNANVEKSADYSLLSNSRNCNITGNVTSGSYAQCFLERCDGINVNFNFAESSRILLALRCNNIKGNIVAGNMTYVNYSSYINLNVSRGSLNLINVEHSIFDSNGTNTYATNLNNCKFEIYNCNNFEVNGAYSSNFNMRNAAGKAVLRNLNNVDFVERDGANYTITKLDNCRNTWISANTVSGTIENAYNMRLNLKNNNANFTTLRVDKCEITGFPTSTAYTTNCTFNASIPQALFRNSRYVTWANVWPHATPRGSSGFDTLYRTKAGLQSVDNFSGCYLNCNDGSLVYSTESWTNSNNMQTDVKDFYNGTVTANLPNYNTNIRLNVDCRVLNLGIFQAGPPHGFQNATISANTIYAKGNMSSSYVQVNCDTKIYCENYCNVCFTPYVININSVLQPVILINNYDHYNSSNQSLFGGLTRIGSLSTRTGPRSLSLYFGAFVFINNAVLGRSYVRENSVLFLGSNVTQANGITVESGGLVVNKATWGSHASEIQSRIGRGQFAWNFTDSGPWGKQSLLNYCLNV